MSARPHSTSASTGSKGSRQLARATGIKSGTTRRTDDIFREHNQTLFASNVEEVAWLRSAVKESQRIVLNELGKAPPLSRAEMPQNHRLLFERYRALKSTLESETPASELEKPSEKVPEVPSSSAPSDKRADPPRVAARLTPLAQPKAPPQPPPPPQTKPPPPPQTKPPQTSQPLRPPTTDRQLGDVTGNDQSDDELSNLIAANQQKQRDDAAKRARWEVDMEAAMNTGVVVNPALAQAYGVDVPQRLLRGKEQPPSRNTTTPPRPLPAATPTTVQQQQRPGAPSIPAPAEPELLSSMDSPAPQQVARAPSLPPQLLAPPQQPSQVWAPQQQQPILLPNYAAGVPMHMGGMGGMGGAAGGLGLPGCSAYAMVQAKPKKAEKFKSQSAEELMGDLAGQLCKEIHTKHLYLSKHPCGGADAIVPCHGGMGYVNCNVCCGAPSFQAGKSAHGTLKHLASPGHFGSWYRAKYPDANLPKPQMQDVYNQFAHGMHLAKCGCEFCRPPNPSKRARHSLLSMSQADVNEPRLAALPVEKGGLGDLSSWDSGTTQHAPERTY